MRLSDLLPSCVDFFAQFQWLVAGLVFTKVLSHHRVPVLHVGLAGPFFGHLLFICCMFFPSGLRCATHDQPNTC